MQRILIAVVASLIAWASAADVAVHPFRSQDPVLGVAVAERLAGAIEGVEVLGPELVPALVAPIVVPGGFFNPVALLPSGVTDRSGVALLGDALGIDAVSGAISIDAEGLRLELWGAIDGRVRSAVLTAPADAPERLAAGGAAVVARWIDAEVGAVRPLDLSGPDGEAARARALLGAGFVAEAQAALAGLEAPEAADARLLADLDAVLAGATDAPEALAAVVALYQGEGGATAAAFERWVAAGAPPVANVWLGAIARSVQDDAAARVAFDAAAGYPYGRAARAADRATAGDEAGAREDLARVEQAGGGPAALAAASLVAQSLEDAALEDRLLEALGRRAPSLPYAFERRSFLAFDRDDALTAAQTLTIAVDLDPGNDLYWTNLGWARYLLGDLERSEVASRRAIELDAGQYIARYNLGLVEVVTGRLDDALATYAGALRLDPDVDDEAVVDLVVAEERYPDALGVPFALGVLLEQEGDRAGAAAAFERYAERATAAPGAVDAGRVAEARRPATTLSAPPEPIEVLGAPRLSLGARGAALDALRAGDVATVAFEVSTPGDALPRRLEVEATLRGPDGDQLAFASANVDVPTGAIGFVVDALRLEVPVDLPAGGYALDVVARGDGLEAVATRDVPVEGVANPFRRLVGRGLVPTALETGQALVAERDLALGDAALLDRLVQELQLAAPAAGDVLPTIEAGRFAGLDGGEAFAVSGPDDVADFLAHLLASDARDSSFAFVDAYAQWIVDGAPEVP
jgi:tetratricopeptide (TPR) repeat protein